MEQPKVTNLRADLLARLTLLYAGGRIALLSEKPSEKALPKENGMQNAHLRMGNLTFVRQTRDTTTSVSANVDSLIAEPQSGPKR